MRQISLQNSGNLEKMILMHYSDDFDKHDISEFSGWARAGDRYDHPVCLGGAE